MLFFDLKRSIVIDFAGLLARYQSSIEYGTVLRNKRLYLCEDRIALGRSNREPKSIVRNPLCNPPPGYPNDLFFA